MMQNVVLSVGRGKMMARSLSYVSLARQLQRLKEDDTYCRDELTRAKFLFYDKGRPLLGKDGRAAPQPLWLDYQQSRKLVSDLEQRCALLGVAADSSPQLAANTGQFYLGSYLRHRVLYRQVK